jgi:hypothetical protein
LYAGAFYVKQVHCINCLVICHVGTSCARSDFLFYKKSATRFSVSPFVQKIAPTLHCWLAGAYDARLPQLLAVVCGTYHHFCPVSHKEYPFGTMDIQKNIAAQSCSEFTALEYATRLQ